LKWKPIAWNSEKKPMVIESGDWRIAKVFENGATLYTLHYKKSDEAMKVSEDVEDLKALAEEKNNG